MPSLPPPLQNRLRDVLFKCAPFGSNDALRAVFSDARITAWQHNVPEAASSASRVSFLVSQFMDAWNANGENALSLFLCALSAYPDRGVQCPTADLCALSAEVHTALIAGKIAECERELAQVKDHQARGWSDPAYSQRRATELQTQIQTWEARKDDPPSCVSAVAPATVGGTSQQDDASGVVAKPSESAQAVMYTDLELHISGRDVSAGVYAVTAEVDGGGEYSGTMQMATAQRESLLTMTDPAEYGSALFEALFQGNVLAAYIGARAKAPEGRLRLRLRIAHEDADLHALVWERLHYPLEGGAFPVATDAKLLFSRYICLQRSTASTITGPVRMLCVIADPQDLEEKGFPCLDVQVEITNLRTALDGLRQAGVDITIMPGRTGLSNDLAQALESAGYTIRSGAATLDNVFEALAYAPGYHLLHFVGHGTFSQRAKQAALVFEKSDGQMQLVTDSD